MLLLLPEYFYTGTFKVQNVNTFAIYEIKSDLSLVPTFSWRSSLDNSTELLVFCCIFCFVLFFCFFCLSPSQPPSFPVTSPFVFVDIQLFGCVTKATFLFFFACLFSSHTNSGSFVPLGFQSSSLSKACGWRRGQKKKKKKCMGAPLTDFSPSPVALRRWGTCNKNVLTPSPLMPDAQLFRT